MPLTAPRYTLQDLESFPDDGYVYELLDGILLVTPAPAPLHDVISVRLTLRLAAYLEGSGATVHGHGSVEVEPATHLEPDLLVVAPGEPAGGVGPRTKWTEYRRWWLAVEISGRGSRIYDRDHKTPAYLAIGVEEVWRIDLEERCAYLTRRDGPKVDRRTDTLTWHAPGLAEPLTISITSLFEGTRAGLW
jgi:Uma2 family endonuclease